MTADLMKRRKRWLQMLVGLMLVFFNLIAFNYLSSSHFSRIDLTETGMYTLSPDTERILGRMDDLVTVKFFLTRDLPTGYHEIIERSEDLLEEFRIAADGKLQVVFLDPSDNPPLRAEAEQYGIPEIPCPVLSSDSYEEKLAYIGIVVLYEDRYEVISDARYPQILEYELLMRIVRVLRKETPVIAFNQTSAHVPDNLPPELRAQLLAQSPNKDKHDIAGDYVNAAGYLKKQYDVETVNLNEKVPVDIRTLVVANTENLDDTALYHLDQFMMRGGKLVLLLCGVNVDFNRMQGMPRDMPKDIKLDSWLAHYGIEVDKNLIMDEQCSMVPFQSGARGGYSMQVVKPFPPVIRLTASEINEVHPIAQGIRDITFPFCSSIKLDPPEGAVSEILLKSSPMAWAMEEHFMLHPERIMMPSEEARGRFDLAGIIEGEFISYYAGRPVPESVLPEEMKQDEAGMMPDDDGSRAGEVPAQDDEEPGEKAEPVRKGEGSPEKEEPSPQDRNKVENDVPGGGVISPQEGNASTALQHGKPAEGKDEKADEPEGEANKKKARSFDALEHPPDMLLRSKKTAIFVAGSSEFIGRIFSPMEKIVYAYTLRFFGNTLDYMTVSEDFSNVRTRAVTVRYMDPKYKEEPYKGILKVIGALGGAVIVVFIGLSLFFMRRAAQRREVVL